MLVVLVVRWRHSRADKIYVRQGVSVLIYTLNGGREKRAYVCVSATFDGTEGLGGRGKDMRTIPERMATYFLTTISLANLFSPESTNEVEAAGLSETATTIPLRKPEDDIPRPEKVEEVESGERAGRECVFPTRSTLSKTFPGR